MSSKRDTEALSSSTSRTHTPSMKADSTSGTIAAVAALAAEADQVSYLWFLDVLRRATAGQRFAHRLRSTASRPAAKA